MSTKYDIKIDQGATFSTQLTWTTGLAVSVTGVASTDTFTAAGVQLSNGQAVFVRVDGGLGNLATHAICYVRDASANTFKLALTSGGSAINLTTNGSATLWRCVDLTGYTARMDIKATGQTTVSLTTENSRITLGADGTITLSIPATTTATMGAGVYAYDLELVSGSTVTRVIEGAATVSANITT